MDPDDPKEVVRRGYDALSHRYDEAFGAETKYQGWLDDVCALLPAGGGTVLDVGCGSGVPVARLLSAAGHRVTGVDISGVQVHRARQLVPAAAFVRADATAVEFPAASFDAVVSFYALIHIPLAEQLPLLARIAGWLRPGGWFVGTTGHRAWTGLQGGLAGRRGGDVVEPC
jgi:SAM-dependent methyltransferase